MHNITRPLMSSNAGQTVRSKKSSLFHGLMSNWNVKYTSTVETNLANKYVFYKLHKMIADTRADKLALQAEAMKAIKKGITANSANKKNENEKIKDNSKIESNTEKPKFAKESVPFKHQSKTVDNNQKGKSKLELFTQKSTIDSSKVEVNKDTAKGGFSNSSNKFKSKLDIFSKEEFDKQEEKHIQDNLDRN